MRALLSAFLAPKKRVIWPFSGIFSEIPYQDSRANQSFKSLSAIFTRDERASFTGEHVLTQRIRTFDAHAGGKHPQHGCNLPGGPDWGFGSAPLLGVFRIPAPQGTNLSSFSTIEGTIEAGSQQGSANGCRKIVER